MYATTPSSVRRLTVRDWELAENNVVAGGGLIEGHLVIVTTTTWFSGYEPSMISRQLLLAHIYMQQSSHIHLGLREPLGVVDDKNQRAQLGSE